MEPRKLFALFDQAGDAAFAVEPNGRICYWSHHAEQLLGFPQEQALSKNCDDILAGRDAAGCTICSSDCHVLELARRQQTIAAYDLHAATAWGELKWINISVIVAHVKSGPSPLTVHLMRDIEERKNVENIAREIMVRVGELTGRQADEVPRNVPQSISHLGSSPYSGFCPWAKTRKTSPRTLISRRPRCAIMFSAS